MTGSAEDGLRPEQVAEVIVAASERGEARRGTGYLFAPGKLLTAAHVVDGTNDVCVRLQADRPGERTFKAVVQYRHEAIDVAVLALAEEPGTDIVPAVFGGVGDQDAVLPCTTMGYPRFKLRTDEDGSRFRDVEHIHTNCAVLSNRREGTLDLTVCPSPADDPDPDRDPWEGMSGAAVFGNGRLVGIVARRHGGNGTGRIAASRVDRWAEALTGAELAALERSLDCALSPGALPDALPATTFDLIQEAYRAQLTEDFAPEELKDRESELRDLTAFCGGPQQYLRLQGRPWAGKTALAAWFALHPPRGVVPVWFFITSRNARQSDSDAFTGALIDQLAAIAGHAPSGHHSPAARDGLRGLLLRKAAERVAQQGGTLLLVVDGLDEDQSLAPGGNGPSIASLLPRRPPPNVRVLVTGRPSPDLPLDVKDEHPLRHCRVLDLVATEEARHIEYEAKLDLRRALSGDRVQVDLVGLLTAARGTLTVDDLRELTGAQTHELRRRLGSAFGRILRERGTGGGADSGGDVTLYVAGRGFLFAHETLLAAAQEALGRDVDAYWERLHAWAESYRRQGWPQHTPLYLLQPYGRLVTFLNAAHRAAALATDVRRRDRLREVTGSDAACLAEIAAAGRVVRRVAPDDLGTLASLVAAGDLLARRNKLLHPEIPAVYAGLGRVRHAIGLAHSIFEPVDRARALSAVARVLAGTGDRRAVGLAEEAVRLIQQLVAERPKYYDEVADEETDAALGTLAAVLMGTGNHSEALRRLGELRQPASPQGIEAVLATARAAGDAERAERLLKHAEGLAEQMDDLYDAAYARAGTAAEWTARGAPDRAAVLHDSLAALSEGPSAHLGNMTAVVAEVLHSVRPSQAERALQLSLAYAEGVLRKPGTPGISARWSDGYGVHRTVTALAATGRVDEALRLRQRLNLAKNSVWHHLNIMTLDTSRAVAEAWARAGRVAEAWAELDVFDDPVIEYERESDRSVARVARLLVACGSADDLETLLLTTEDSKWRSVATALVVLAESFAETEPERALRLLQQAENAHDLTGEVADSGQAERLVHLASALATAGLPHDAERLVETIGTPDVRAWGFAAVARAVGGEDTALASRLAERASEVAAGVISTIEVIEGHALVTAVVQAWASVGAADRALEAMAQLRRKLEVRGSIVPSLHAHAEAAAGLWRHHPKTADRLAQEAMSAALHVPVPEVGRLLATVAPYDSERSRYVQELVRELDDAWDLLITDRALLGLLKAIVEPASAPRFLDQVAAEHERLPFYRPGDVEVLAHAALGDLAAAETVIRSMTVDDARAKALVALAEYVACVPVAPLSREFLDYEGTARRLAAHFVPPPAGPDLPHARALLAEALTPDGWHHAVPVLAALDIDAVRAVRDVVFAHVGIHD
ncbi:trypsin-like peptidase domain-containing protein [Streptomyces sp. R28]|uniref:Trypsin-like peptidase domain-containing protein n=1 Tax=Streptomyces sp. R28 TaxID=3238628 RepID=A0AB39Q0S7_9ACTN